MSGRDQNESQRRRKSTGTKGAMGSFRGTHGEREPITGVEGRAPSGVPGQSPWSGGQGAKPPEAESFLALGRATDRANLYTLCSILSNPLQLYGSWLGGAEFPTGASPP